MSAYPAIPDVIHICPRCHGDISAGVDPQGRPRVCGKCALEVVRQMYEDLNRDQLEILELNMRPPAPHRQRKPISSWSVFVSVSLGVMALYGFVFLVWEAFQ